jgi:hypothetical protein
MIRARTGEGRERAKARGQHMGRPPKIDAGDPIAKYTFFLMLFTAVLPARPRNFSARTANSPPRSKPPASRCGSHPDSPLSDWKNAKIGESRRI